MKCIFFSFSNVWSLLLTPHETEQNLTPRPERITTPKLFPHLRHAVGEQQGDGERGDVTEARHLEHVAQPQDDGVARTQVVRAQRLVDDLG